MIRRHIGLHGKFVASLLVAAALPFFIGLIFFETMGYRYMLEKKANQHQIDASSLVAAINQAANAEGDKLRIWLASEPGLLDFVADKTREAHEMDQEVLVQQTQLLDEIWASLPASDPKIRGVVENAPAEYLRKYQVVHKAAAEILITDAMGRIVAASNKSTDYNQADEYWWQRGVNLEEGLFWRDTIHFDESSQVFTIDIVLPVYREKELIGVIKVGVEVAQLVPHLIMRGIQADSSWYFVLRTGQVLISSDAQVKPLEQSVPSELLNHIRRKQFGWTIENDHHDEECIIGFAAFGVDYIEPNAYIVFSSRSSDLFEPLWGNFIGLAVAGSSLLGLCLLAGFYLIQRKVLSPLFRIESAIRSLSVLARLRRQKTEDKRKIHQQHQEVEDRLRDIQKIRTGDQIELLAREISTMISRVLRYQSDVAALEKKTDDLDVAPDDDEGAVK